MKTFALAVFALAVFAGALVFFREADERIRFSDFSWSVSGKMAPVSFSVANRTDQNLTVVLLLEAHNVVQSDTSSPLILVGRKRLEVKLKPSEAKRVQDTMDLLVYGSTETRVSYSLGIKEP